MDYTINLRGQLMDLSQPQVMGILNVTPDSFYAGSRTQTEQEIAQRANQIVEEGGSIIDVGGYSTRPGASEVSEAEEMERLRFALAIVRKALPSIALSVDTFRPDVARMAVEEFGADIIKPRFMICCFRLPRRCSNCVISEPRISFSILALALVKRCRIITR